MTHRCLISTVAMAAVTLAGCEQKPSRPATVNTASRVGAYFAGPSAIISSTACTGTKNPLKVKFKIKESLLKTLGSADQTAEREVSVEDPNHVDTPQAFPPVYSPSKYQPTVLDMSVPASGGVTTWTQIVIKIKNNTSDKIRFMPVRDANGNDSPTDSSVAVLAETSQVAAFCGREPITQDDNNHDIIKFGVKLAVGQRVSINIGLLIPDKKNPGYVIPIYLDPNMKNTG